MDGQASTENTEEAAAVEDDQQEQEADSDADQDGYAEEFTYDEQDGDGDAESMDGQTGTEQAGEVIIVEDLPEEQQADTYSDNDGYEHYGYGEEPMDGPDRARNRPAR